MPTPISSEVAGAAINNAVDQGWFDVFSGWMYAQNCAETVLQWRIFYDDAGSTPDTIQVYTYVAGQWVLETFPGGDAGVRCQSIVSAIEYLQETVVIGEYRLLRVTGALAHGTTIAETTCMDGFPATWEPGMTEYLTPDTDVVGSILESSVVWNLDADTTCGIGCAEATWPTPTT